MRAKIVARYTVLSAGLHSSVCKLIRPAPVSSRLGLFFGCKRFGPPNQARKRTLVLLGASLTLPRIARAGSPL